MQRQVLHRQVRAGHLRRGPRQRGVVGPAQAVDAVRVGRRDDAQPRDPGARLRRRGLQGPVRPLQL